MDIQTEIINELVDANVELTRENELRQEEIIQLYLEIEQLKELVSLIANKVLDNK